MSPDTRRALDLALTLVAGLGLGWSLAPPPSSPPAKAPATAAKAQIGYPPLAGRALRATRTCLADTALVSQARLAALAGISATRISRVERGLDTLTTAEADRLYRVLAPMVRQRIGDRTLVWLALVHQRAR